MPERDNDGKVTLENKRADFMLSKSIHNLMAAVILVTFISRLALQCPADELKTNEWGPITNGLRMSISLDYPLELSSNFKAGETTIKATDPIIIASTLTNMSTNDTFIYRAGHGWEDPYSYVVKTPSGKRISGRRKDEVGGSGAWYQLTPHQRMGFTINLSDIFKFGELGTYTVTVQREQNSDEKGSFTIVSNPLTFKIVAEK